MKLEYQLGHSFSFQKRDNLDFRLHAHGEVELVFMLRGTCRAVCGSTAVSLGAGDVFVAFPNQPHSYEDSRDVEAWVLIVPVKPYLADWYHTLTVKAPRRPVLRASSELLDLAETAFADFPNADASVIQGYMMVLFGKLLKHVQLQPQLTGAEGALRRVLEYCNANYRQNPNRIQIARAVGYNESYVSHLFAQIMHTSVPEYIHRLQIDDACDLLRQTDWAVARIAGELGFASLRNFNRVFLSQMGMTPSRYRATGRSGAKTQKSILLV